MAYQVQGYPGIAWNIVGRSRKRHEVTAVMVGDDRRFTFHESEVSRLKPGSYCPSCGQVGGGLC